MMDSIVQPTLPFPEKETLKEKVRAALLNGRQLTTLDAMRDFNSVDLRKLISLLRREGMAISDKWATSTNRKRFKIYSYKGNV